jgi:hydrogenase/urease accessory protein HupE
MDSAGYAVGFLLASALLHAAGALFAVTVRTRMCPALLRLAGVAVSFAGIGLVLSV